jgi:serine/threonine protein kinase
VSRLPWSLTVCSCYDVAQCKQLYLRACRPTVTKVKEALRLTELLAITLQVVQGCEFLESRKVVHRALMAKNVLVGVNHLDVRLSGFGSLREVLRADEYVKTSDTKDSNLNIRFMAPESFTDNRFSVKSDVWYLLLLLLFLFFLHVCRSIPIQIPASSDNMLSISKVAHAQCNTSVSLICRGVLL